MSRITDNYIHRLSGRNELGGGGGGSTGPTGPSGATGSTGSAGPLVFTVGPNAYNDYPDIQSAINAATGAAFANPISIQVEEGVYNGFVLNVDFVYILGKGAATQISTPVVISNNYGELRDLCFTNDITRTNNADLRMFDCELGNPFVGAITINGAAVGGGGTVVMSNCYTRVAGVSIIVSDGILRLDGVQGEAPSGFMPNLTISDTVFGEIIDCIFGSLGTTSHGGFGNVNMTSCRVIGTVTFDGVSVFRVQSCIFLGATFTQNVDQNFFYLGQSNIFGDIVTMGVVQIESCYLAGLFTHSGTQAILAFGSHFNSPVTENYGGEYLHCRFGGTLLKQNGVSSLSLIKNSFVGQVSVTSTGGGNLFSNNFSNAAANPSVNDTSGGAAFRSDGANTSASGTVCNNMNTGAYAQG